MDQRTCGDRSVFPHAAGDAAPDLEVGAVGYLDRRVLRILRHQENAAALLADTLEREFVVDAGDDDAAARHLGGTIDNQKVGSGRTREWLRH